MARVNAGVSVSLTEHLFVYGTLRRNSENHFAALLARSGHFLGAATVQGRMYLIADYPGLVPSDDLTDRVLGDVYQLDDADAIYRELDEYEGPDFRRVVLPVLLNSDANIHAAVYIYALSVAGKKRINPGEWNPGNFPHRSVV